MNTYRLINISLPNMYKIFYTDRRLNLGTSATDADTLGEAKTCNNFQYKYFHDLLFHCIISITVETA